MQNLIRNGTLLMAAWAIIGAQRDLPAADHTPLAHEPVPAEPMPVEAESILAEDPLACCEYPCLPAPFAAAWTGQPAWYFQLEGLALKREPSGDRTFQAFVDRVFTEEEGVFVPTDSVFDVLGTGNLHYDYQGGGRALIGRTVAPCSAFEVSYFEVTDWDDLAAVRDDTEFIQEVDGAGNPTLTFPASLFSPFSDFGDPPIVGLDYNNLASLRYESSLHNLEWNLRRWILTDPHRLTTSLLVGGRYLSIGETFQYFTQSAAPAPDGATNDVSTDTENNMIGAQVGAAFEFYLDPGWWLDCEIKGAIFDNDASQQTVFRHEGVDAYQGAHTGRRESHITSFALDLRLNATFLITPRLAVIGGYQALWVDGLALASDNMSQDVDVLTSGPATLAEEGKVVYHGPHLGLSWVW